MNFATSSSINNLYALIKPKEKVNLNKEQERKKIGYLSSNLLKLVKLILYITI